MMVTTIFNPFDEDELAWQVGEPLEGFIDMVRPSEITTEMGPWIQIVNPRIGEDLWNASMNPDMESLVRDGELTLSEHAYTMTAKSAQDAQSRRFLRDELLQNLYDIGCEYHSTAGKWMIFVNATVVDNLWAAIAAETHAGNLGVSARVSTRDGAKKPVIQIYTQDWHNTDDVWRVMFRLRELDLIGENHRIYYKPEIFSHLKIYPKNNYGIESWTHCSTDRKFIVLD